MRITEARMTELAAARTTQARTRVAEAGEQLSSGLAIARPSDDPSSWASAERAKVRRVISEARGGVIATSSERATAADAALGSLGDIVSRSRELAVQAGNATLGAADRSAIAQEIRALAGSALAVANTQGNDGQFLFAGSRGDAAPFDAAGVYTGDTLTASVETSPSAAQVVAIDGTALTAVSGVNILAELDAFATGLEANDIAAVQAAVGSLDTAAEQVSRARSAISAMVSSLDLADVARGDLEFGLTDLISRRVEADSIAAASDLASATQSLQVSSTVTQMIIDVTRGL